ncbi:pyruvate dehydrogenase complex dihydrolipoamide acetyltransferase [Neorickettsia helminthoeca str. Oregon]|uniref:Acetyltransferase component of pyruvate dehydrogenase complex n=2 Tax=Neorickettsia helminthoeca TaxID=33994 RepID=X5GXP3_9RICK|nr:pyruvate dehydrogenase complex dihydrolipoamide acetyltransferase [Neorickettsia helminthoeca str. Oregon]
MKEGTLSKWLVSEGEKIKAGQVMAEIETDKATVEFEAVDEGTLAKILIPDKATNIKVNEPIGVLLEDGESEEDLENFLLTINETPVGEPIKSVEPDKLSTIGVQASMHAAASGKEKSDRILATPLAKKIASINNIDLSLIQTGSGPNGRIVKDDLKGVIKSSGEVSNSVAIATELAISPMRRVIAERLVESKQNIPHFYLSVDCHLGNLLKTREEINGYLGEKITINDFVVKATAFALGKHPDMNVSWNGDVIKQHQAIDVSVAVAIPDGLITPIVHAADKLSLSRISTEVKKLVQKAKDNKLQPIEFQGGSFTISNLGMYGIKEFTAIINPPQAAILAVGAGRKAPVIVDDAIVVRNIMTLTLSCDHRVIDGALAARFLQTLKQAIEKPAIML